MSEQYKSGNEHHKQHESLNVDTEALKQHHERELTKAEKEHGNEEHVELVRNKVEQHALSTDELAPSEKSDANKHPVFVHKQMKDMSFSRSMTRVRKHLSAPSRAFSKVIHAGPVDKSSEFIGKTVARPSSMLVGAIFAFIGTSALLWITKFYGYEYNYLIVILLFVGGAIVGAAGEGLLKLIHKKQQ